MNSIATRVLACGAAAAVALVGMYLSMHTETHSPPASLPASQTAAVVYQPTQSALPREALGVRPSAPVIAALSKSAQIDALMKAGKPADLYAAYKLVRDCASAREAAATAEPSQRKEWRTPAPADACGDITNGQSTSHLQWLEIAAIAGVRDAALSYAVETQHETSDADHVRRMLAVFEAGAKNGDAYSLIAISNRAEDERDWSRALTYWIAANEVIRKTKGKDAPHSRDIENRLAAQLTPDQRTAALEAGKRLGNGSQQ